MKKLLLSAVLVSLIATGCVTVLPKSTATNVKSHSLICDNMVFQRNMPIVVWGTATPDGIVNVSLNGEKASVKTEATGKWKLELAPMKAGGPYELTIAGKDKIVFKNVMLGDVWVCSGQSNMGVAVKRSNNGHKEIKNANYPNIRLFSVPRAVSDKPLESVKASWKVCTPANIPSFSAVAYFFGRKLNKDLKVSVGLIHTSWGGTPAEAWTTYNTLANDPDFSPITDRYKKAIKKYPEAVKKYQEALKVWKKMKKGKKTHTDPKNTRFVKGWASVSFNDSDWKSMKVPKIWEEQGLKIDGLVWFRKEIEIPKAWEGKELMLHLGAIDDFDTTYFNGVKVGATGIDTQEFWIHPRKYKIPAKLVKAGKAVIAVRVFDHFNVGGFVPTEPMRIFSFSLEGGKEIALKGQWKYRVAEAMDPKELVKRRKPRSPFGPGHRHSPSGLYNAMINPLIPFRIKGAIWYQGESNASRAWQYRKLMKAMIIDWRNKWKQGDFPFFIVQLANFAAAKNQPIESAWAELREAQVMAMELPKVGLAVTIDIGEAKDIHPRNKQDVGKRLALAAEKIAYGMDIVYSGPTYKFMKVDGDKIIITFDNVGGGLVAKGGLLKRFAIAEKNGKFVWADAKINGNTVIVSSPEVKKPTAVRYAWSHNPDGCNLYNKEGLPASPFRTDKRKSVTYGKK